MQSTKTRSAAEAAARFGNQDPGYVYSRFTNPTVRQFERRLASLEQGEACMATASGMSAIMTTVLALMKAGDHMVCASAVFGSTYQLFSMLSRFGLQCSFVPLSDLKAWEAAIKPETKLFYVETPSNPLTELADLVGKGDRTIVYYRAGKWPIPKYLALLLSCVKSDKVSISYLKSMCQE